tara:strand:+ start:4724 stop:6688 length:1965 start_codon:yes stop_codon:yes gene_type:complete
MMDLEAIQKLIVEQKFSAAIEALEPILKDDPQPDALYLAAVCHRYLGEAKTSLQVLERLKLATPGHGRAYQEEGHVHRALGNDNEALAAYRQAGQINPALVASFRGQLEILLKAKDVQSASMVKQHLEFLQRLPKPLLAVMDLIGEGKMLKAEDLCRAFLQKVPHHPEAMRLLADIGVRLGVMDEADFLLESLVMMAPDFHRARIDHIQVLRKRQKYQAALEQANILLETNPDNPQYRSIYAIEQMQTGDFDEALENFDRVLEQVPGDPNTLTSKGHALKTVGQGPASIEAYKAAVVSRPDHGEAYYSLANLKTYRFSAEEILQMQGQEHNLNLSVTDRVYFNFALAKATEDAEQYDEAFRFYELGNQLKRAQSRYDAEKMSADMAEQIRVCNREMFAAVRGHDAPDPIFIVGLPRAGSTLLEQILSSHSQVDGTMELPNILSLSHRLRRGPDSYPDALTTLDASTAKAYGEAFIEETRVHRQEAPFFIDKMPNNFRHIGLIKLILPNAKIIDARRHPMACCFSGYKQLFAEGQEFSYSLSDIGQYYRDYVLLMDHWDTVLPGEILRVQHEEVVSDLEGQVRRILEFCGLPFEAACVDYHKTERNVRTPSSEQVRQPIFSTSLEQWRHFESHLEPLVRALGPEVLERYPLKGNS